MNKKVWIPIALVGLLLLGGIAYLYRSLDEQKKVNQDMQELAELDKKEMQNEYEQFAQQYSEMKTQINNDSIVEQLTQEQLKTQKLLEELRNVRATDAREITRLKKELATCRAVIRSYVLEIDSLNRLNQNLTAENTRVKGQYEEATRRIESLNTEKSSLSEKVAIAAQLDAVGISMSLNDKKGKSTKKIELYVRIQTPNGQVLTNGGTFDYENRSLQYSMKKQVEYTGNETPVSMFWNISEFLSEGTYKVSIFADGHMIGSRSITF